MRRISRRVAMGVLGTPACGGLVQAAGQEPVDSGLPPGVRAIWDVEKAFRESTPSRERICINGLWRWQPAGNAADIVPARGWGYLRAPESWPGGSQRWVGPQVFHPHPSWDKAKMGDVTAAWYQREINVPRQW